MSLMSSFYTGVSGLTVNQRGVTVAAHNLANVETAGYVRQQMETTDAFYSTNGQNYISKLQVGYGSNVTNVKQVRDIFLDKTYREEKGREGFYLAQYETTNEIEDILGETEGVAFQDNLEEFWVSLQELAKVPEDLVTRSTLIQTATSFIERAEQIFKQIEEYQTNLNYQIRTSVNKINDIAEQIYHLNMKIQNVEAGNIENANDLRDQRNALLDELSGIVKINYKEDASGVVSVFAEDYSLVTNDIVYKVGIRRISEDPDYIKKYLDAGLEVPDSTMIEPYWPDYGGIDMFNLHDEFSPAAENDIGSLKGLLLARGDKVGRWSDKPVEPQRTDFNDDAAGELAYQKAMMDFNKDVDDYEKSVSNSVIVGIQVQFDTLIHGICTKLNDMFCPNINLDHDVTLLDGTSINMVQAGDRYITQNDMTISNGKVIKAGTELMIYDFENAPIGMDVNKTPGEALFDRKSMNRYEKLQLADGSDIWIYIPEDKDDNYSLFTIGEIEVNDRIMKDPTLIPLSDNRGTGDFSVKICEDMLTVWQSAFDTISPTEHTPLSFDGYYTEMIGVLGTNGEKFKHIYKSQEQLVGSVDNQREASHGVASDDELTNIIKFQQGYNANSRFINVVNEMLEHLLNTLGS